MQEYITFDHRIFGFSQLFHRRIVLVEARVATVNGRPHLMSFFSLSFRRNKVESNMRNYPIFRS